MGSDGPTDSAYSTENTRALLVNTRLYSEEAVFRTCYLFTDRCYLFLRYIDDGCICIEIEAKETVSLKELAGELANELINQRVRVSLGQETLPIRQMIVAQAFAEADFRAS